MLMIENSPEFQFQIPEFRKDASRTANLVLQLGALSGRLAMEQRTLVDHPDDRAENVAEHANMLTRVAPLVAAELYPKLDSGLVARYAAIHDDLEAYVGDTPTFRPTIEILEHKKDLEAKALEKLKADFAHIPNYVDLIETYENQSVPEARFVRAVDKLMPITVHFNQGGRTLAANWEPAELVVESERRSQAFLIEYPEFEAVTSLWVELCRLAAVELFNK